jgi:hypothetical protein
MKLRAIHLRLSSEWMPSMCSRTHIFRMLRGAFVTTLLIWCNTAQSSVPSFCVYLRFLTTESLGRKSSIICDEICSLLRDSLICVRGIETDGDRTSLPCHNSIFALYKNCLNDNMSTIPSRGSDRVWELADPLHLLKYQRCRLRHSLVFIRFSEKQTPWNLISFWR